MKNKPYVVAKSLLLIMKGPDNLLMLRGWHKMKPIPAAARTRATAETDGRAIRHFLLRWAAGCGSENSGEPDRGREDPAGNGQRANPNREISRAITQTPVSALRREFFAATGRARDWGKMREQVGPKGGSSEDYRNPALQDEGRAGGSQSARMTLHRASMPSRVRAETG